MAHWEDNRDYERRSEKGWVAPFVVLALIVLAGVILIRPENVSNSSDVGQVGVGGGPPSTNELNTTTTITPTRVPSLSPTPSKSESVPTTSPLLENVSPSF